MSQPQPSLRIGESPLGDILAHPAIGGRRFDVAQDTVIYDQGAAADSIFYIHRGQVRIYQIAADGSERLIDILGVGEWFGFTALAGTGEYVCRAVAAKETSLTEAPAERVLQHVARSPAAAITIIRDLSRHLKHACEESARLIFQDCNQRLIDAMLRFSHSAAATAQGEAVVLHLTHEQLAQAVGAARETISLALTEMRHQNVVRTGRNRLVFNRDNLREFALKSKTQPALASI